MKRIGSMSKSGILGLALAVGACTAYAQTAQPGGMGQQQQPGGSAPGGAQSPMNTNGSMAMDGMGQAGGASMQDKDFLQTAAEGGLFEVMAGKLAAEQASNPQVKQFGQWMVTQHSQLNADLKPFLDKANIPVPTELKGKEKSEYEKLQGLQGDAFDQAYVPMMVKDHKNDLNAFEMEATQTQMPGLRAAVMHGEQVITAHLKRIKKISKSMKQSS